MKKIYMVPTLNVEQAQPISLLCESFTSNVGLEGGEGSSGTAHAPESNWDIWGEE